MGLLLGLDFGTGGAKACLLAPDGEIQGYAYQEYALRHERPGWSEHDATRYWPVACELISRVLTESKKSGGEVTGVGVSSALPSLVLAGRDGGPVAPGINLMDRRAQEEVHQVQALIGEQRVQALTANRLEDHPALVNLLWYRNHRPELLDEAVAALTIDGYITYRLTGRITLNRSAGAFHGVAYDIREGVFDSDILDLLELPRRLLPDVVEPVEVIGSVTSTAADESGLSTSTAVVGGQVDCNAGWLAGGAITPGDIQLNLGTSGVLGVVHDQKSFLCGQAGRAMVNIPYTTAPASVFTAVATTMTGGQGLRYLRDTIGAVETQTSQVLGVSPYDLLTLQARDIPPGSEGLIVLPYLMGERTPIWDSSARGVLFGLSLHHGRGHLVRAFLEGVAYALYHSLQVLVDGGLEPNWPLVMNEGGARSPVWRRIITDVLGVPTTVLESAAGAPVGDAILAGVAIGELDDFTIARQWARYGQVLTPNPENHAQYLGYYQIYRDLYADVKERFSALARLNEPGGGTHS
jgi:xylulokinase